MIVSNDSINETTLPNNTYNPNQDCFNFRENRCNKIIFLEKPSPQLRKQNKIKTIHSSLKLEGNTLTQEQITALIENKLVIGPQKDIKEILNAIKVYDQLALFDPFSSKSFLSAHKLLLDGLIEKPGKFRNQNVGIFQDTRVAHIAPPPGNVPSLMMDLFTYLKRRMK